jgi:hypothetical protein
MCPLCASQRNRAAPLGLRGSAQTGGIRTAGNRTVRQRRSAEGRAVRQPRSVRVGDRPSPRGVELAARPPRPATASAGQALAAPRRRQVRTGAGTSSAGPSCGHLLSW